MTPSKTRVKQKPSKDNGVAVGETIACMCRIVGSRHVNADDRRAALETLREALHPSPALEPDDLVNPAPSAPGTPSAGAMRAARSICYEMSGLYKSDTWHVASLIDSALDLPALLAERDRLRLIVSRLPVTADGVPIYPLMELWIDNRGDHLKHWIAGEKVVHVTASSVTGIGHPDEQRLRVICPNMSMTVNCFLSRAYSTRAAAEAALTDPANTRTVPN